MSIFLGCAVSPSQQPPEPEDPCKYRTVPDYDQSCLASVDGKWTIDAESGAMVNKKHRKFCWPTGTKKEAYDCQETPSSSFKENRFGRWNFRGSSRNAGCAIWSASADIDYYGHGKLSGSGWSYGIYFDDYGNVSIGNGFQGKCTTNNYCSGTFKNKNCTGTWTASKTR